MRKMGAGKGVYSWEKFSSAPNQMPIIAQLVALTKETGKSVELRVVVTGEMVAPIRGLAPNVENPLPTFSPPGLRPLLFEGNLRLFTHYRSVCFMKVVSNSPHKRIRATHAQTSSVSPPHSFCPSPLVYYHPQPPISSPRNLGSFLTMLTWRKTKCSWWDTLISFNTKRNPFKIP